MASSSPALPPVVHGAAVASRAMVGVMIAQAAFMVGYEIYVPLTDDSRFRLGRTAAVVSAPFVLLLLVVGARACRALLRAATALLQRAPAAGDRGRTASAWVLGAGIPMQGVWAAVVSALSFGPESFELMLVGLMVAVALVVASIGVGLGLRAAAARV